MIGVSVLHGDLETALRRLKRQVERDGFISAYCRKAEGAQTRTQRRKQKDALCISRIRKLEKKRLRGDESLTKDFVYRTNRDRQFVRSIPFNAGGNGGAKRSWGPGSGSETSNNLTPTPSTGGAGMREAKIGKGDPGRISRV